MEDGDSLGERLQLVAGHFRRGGNEGSGKVLAAVQCEDYRQCCRVLVSGTERDEARGGQPHAVRRGTGQVDVIRVPFVQRAPGLLPSIGVLNMNESQATPACGRVALAWLDASLTRRETPADDGNSESELDRSGPSRCVVSDQDVRVVQIS